MTTNKISLRVSVITVIILAGGTMYPRDLLGLIDCYSTAIPFFRNMLAGDLAYSAALFGIFEFLHYKIPGLKLKTLELK